MQSFDFSAELVPGLPNELGLECLTRLPYTAHSLAFRVCHRWRDLLQSRDFYDHRKKLGYTQKVACLVQAFNAGIVSGPKQPGELPSYGVAVFESSNRCWYKLPPVPKYPDGLPLFCQLASCEGKLVVMGGWNPVSYDPVTDVFIYDFTTQQWKRGKDMPSKRSFFAIGACSGRVYIAGGHDENKNALRTAWVYDLRNDEWTQLGDLSKERDECEGVVIGEDEFWVVSGYGTERQGQFDGSADVFGFKSGQWRVAEGVWEPGRCPRSIVGIGKDGELMNWAELDPAVRVGSCGIPLGDRVLVTGSEYQGGPHGFYTVEIKGGQNGSYQSVHFDSSFVLGYMACDYHSARTSEDASLNIITLIIQSQISWLLTIGARFCSQWLVWWGGSQPGKPFHSMKEALGKSMFIGVTLTFFTGVCFSLFSPAFNSATNDQHRNFRLGLLFRNCSHPKQQFPLPLSSRSPPNHPLRPMSGTGVTDGGASWPGTEDRHEEP
ncbi:hypothetical protein GQ457_10G028670 [Hibiscus cannabinus]